MPTSTLPPPNPEPKPASTALEHLREASRLAQRARQRLSNVRQLEDARTFFENARRELDKK